MLYVLFVIFGNLNKLFPNMELFKTEKTAGISRNFIELQKLLLAIIRSFYSLTTCSESSFHVKVVVFFQKKAAFIASSAVINQFPAVCI